MAGAAFRSAVGGLFWANAVLFAVVATIPAHLAPPGQMDAYLLGTPSACAPQLPLYRAAPVVRYILVLAIFSSAVLTCGIKVAVAGEAPSKDGGGASSTTACYLRALFLAAVSLTAAGAALAGVASVQALEVNLQMVPRCFPGHLRGAVYGSCGLVD